MHKPFSKEYATALAYKMQRYVGASYTEREIEYRVDVVSIIPGAHAD